MSVRKSLLRWEIAGFLFVCAVGTVLQYLFRWTGGNLIVAAFAGVNESTWEHMKLLYLPYFVFTMLQYPVFGEPFPNFFAAKATAALVGLLTIPLVYYAVTGMFGATPDWFNIALFYVSAAVMYLTSHALLDRFLLRGTIWQLLGFALLLVLALSFILFTYQTPRFPLFQDPRDLRYGI